MYNYDRANFTEISESSNQVDWVSALDVKMKFTANHFPPWYTAELNQLLCDKKIFHAKWKDIRNRNRHADHVKFKRLRTMCIRVSQTCYREYTEKMETKIRGDYKTRYTLNKRKERTTLT